MPSAPESVASSLPSSQRFGASDEVIAFARELGVSMTVAEILRSRGYDSISEAKRFLEPKLAHLTPPEQMADRALLAARIARAIEGKERIVVFGDYDCDGITSTAILSSAIQEMGGLAFVQLASRFEGGYGLSAPALERVLAQAPNLVVTCDCGSSDHASLRELEQRQIDCLVIDHHLVPEEPLPALAFLNPHRKECRFAYKGLASCGLALSIVAELRRLLSVELDIRKYLDLVAIGTIADVAPLTLDNRALVRAGLRLIEKAERPGLRALMRRAKFLQDAPISAEDVAFRIAPRLNAPGRMGSPMPALQLLLARSDIEADALADQVEALQLARRATQETIVKQAVEDIERLGYEQAPAIVVGRREWNIGIVGIVAGKLAERYARPVCVFGADGEIARGSLRGPKTLPLYEMLVESASTLTRFGGHQAAAGFELELSRVDAFRQAFVAATARASLVPATDSGSEEAHRMLAEGDDPLSVARELRLLEPCGASNPAPKIGIYGRVAFAKELRGGHLRVELALPRGERISGFAPGQGAMASSLGEQLLMIGSLRTSSYSGREQAEVLVSKLAPWDQGQKP